MQLSGKDLKIQLWDHGNFNHSTFIQLEKQNGRKQETSLIRQSLCGRG